jgi:hypothetical protein
MTKTHSLGCSGHFLGTLRGPFVKKKLHRRLDEIPHFGYEQIVWDVVVLGDAEILHCASQAFIARAAWFVDGCMGEDIWDHCELANECMLGSEVDTSKREVLVTALACALECGLSWMNESVLSKSTADPLLMKGLLCFFGRDIGLTETFKQRYDYYEQHYGHFGGFEQYISGITTDWLPTKREPTWIEHGCRQLLSVSNHCYCVRRRGALLSLSQHCSRAGSTPTITVFFCLKRSLRLGPKRAGGSWVRQCLLTPETLQHLLNQNDCIRIRSFEDDPG